MSRPVAGGAAASAAPLRRGGGGAEGGAGRLGGAPFRPVAEKGGFYPGVGNCPILGILDITL